MGRPGMGQFALRDRSGYLGRDLSARCDETQIPTPTSHACEGIEQDSHGVDAPCVAVLVECDCAAETAWLGGTQTTQDVGQVPTVKGEWEEEDGARESSGRPWRGTSLCQWEVGGGTFYEAEGCRECDLAITGFECAGQV